MVAQAQPLRLFYFPSPQSLRPPAVGFQPKPGLSALGSACGSTLSRPTARPAALAFLPLALSLNHLFIKLNLTAAAAAVAADIAIAAAAGAAIAIAFG